MTPTRSSREPVFASTHRAHGIQVLSDSWRYLFVDELAARQMHKQVDDLLGRTLQECHPGVTGTQVFAALVQCRRERTPTTVSHEFLSTDGDGRELLLQILPMSTGVCVLSTDETANRQPAAQTIAAAEEIEHYLNMILDAAIGGITSAVSPGATDLCAELQTIAALSRAAAARVGELKRLAAGAPAPEPVPEPVPEPATPPPGAGPLRVLVVEDTREVADILVRLLQANGHETLLAHDAAAAQRLWSRSRSTSWSPICACRTGRGST